MPVGAAIGVKLLQPAPGSARSGSRSHDVVRGGARGEVDLAGAGGGGGECSGCGGRCRVGRRLGGSGGRVGDGPGVAGGVDGENLIAVARARAEACVAVGGAGAGRCCDLGEVAAAGALAALDPVAGDTDVVGGRSPGEADRLGLVAVAVSVPGADGGVVSGGVWVVVVLLLL